MPRTEEQFKEIRTQKRSQIMNSAIELFAEKGFDSTSINMIAQRASISKGLIYNYFESKEELIKEIIHEGFDKFLTEFDTNKDGVLTDEEFIHFIDKTFEVIQNNIRFWKLYFMMVAQPKVFKLVEEKLMEILIPFMETMIGFYAGKGYPFPEVHARLFGALMDGVSLNYIVDPENFPVEETKKLIIEKFI